MSQDPCWCCLQQFEENPPVTELTSKSKNMYVFKNMRCRVWTLISWINNWYMWDMCGVRCSLCAGDCGRRKMLDHIPLKDKPYVWQEAYIKYFVILEGKHFSWRKGGICVLLTGWLIIASYNSTRKLTYRKLHCLSDVLSEWWAELLRCWP